jgi:phytoene synthase
MSDAATTSLAESHEFCRRLTRRAARNFYFGLKLLPEQARADMFALYGWMRSIDDIADDNDGQPAELRREQLQSWQSDTHRAVASENVPGLLWPAFGEMVRRHQIPIKVFDDAIEGQRRDIEREPIDNFEQLHSYCYQVAGTVGLASIWIWGFQGGEETETLAIHRGVALQLTNILRDLREDALRGRLYLPMDQLRQAGVTLDSIQSDQVGEGFEALLKQYTERAESYYQLSSDLEQRITPSCRPTLATMTEIYHRLLRRIAANPMAVLRRRVSVPLWSKLAIAWRATH